MLISTVLAAATFTSFSLVKDISSSYKVQFENATICCSSDSATLYPRTILMRIPHRTVPTKDQIMVPETLLKKRKSQEKAREARTADIEKRKKVSHTHFPLPQPR